MPTTYPDVFWVMDPYNPPPVGTLLTAVTFDIIDQNDNGLINRFSNDSIDGVDITASYPGDTVTVTLAGGGTATYTGTTFYLADGREVFTPTDGSTLTDATLVSTTFVTTQGSTTPIELEPVCFTPGTLIETANGARMVETLEPGDLVQTADRGLVPIYLVRHRTLDAEHLADNPNHCPVLFRAGSLGLDLPARDLIVSPQHRMVLRSPVVQRMFGEPEIMVPACQLVGRPGITRLSSAQSVQYVHLLLDHHAVVFAENTPAETLFLGERASESFSQREYDQIALHLPKGVADNMQPARQFVRGKRLRKLLSRHMANNKPLLDGARMKPKDQANTG